MQVGDDEVEAALLELRQAHACGLEQLDPGGLEVLDVRRVVDVVVGIELVEAHLDLGHERHGAER